MMQELEVKTSLVDGVSGNEHLLQKLLLIDVSLKYLEKRSLLYVLSICYLISDSEILLTLLKPISFESAYKGFHNNTTRFHFCRLLRGMLDKEN